MRHTTLVKKPAQKDVFAITLIEKMETLEVNVGGTPYKFDYEWEEMGEPYPLCAYYVKPSTTSSLENLNSGFFIVAIVSSDKTVKMYYHSTENLGLETFKYEISEKLRMIIEKKEKTQFEADKSSATNVF